MLIEMCESNEMIEAYPELDQAGFDVITYSCLDRCDFCGLSPYVLADGLVLEEKDVQSLVSILLTLKEQEDSFFTNEEY